MKTIKELPVDGRVIISIDRKWANGKFGDKNWKGVDKIVADTESLQTEVMSVMKFVENYSPSDESESDAPTANYGDIDIMIENAYVVQDDDKNPTNWRQEHYYENLYEAIERVVGDIPGRSTYTVRCKNRHTEYYTDFKYVVESVYKDSSCSVEGLNLEEEEYLEQLKQYLVVVELKK